MLLTSRPPRVQRDLETSSGFRSSDMKEGRHCANANAKTIFVILLGVVKSPILTLKKVSLTHATMTWGQSERRSLGRNQYHSVAWSPPGCFDASIPHVTNVTTIAARILAKSM